MRDRPGQDMCDVEKATGRLSVREQLEIRRTRLQERIKDSQGELSEIEDSLKLLNKNKQLETLINIIQF